MSSSICPNRCVPPTSASSWRSPGPAPSASISDSSPTVQPMPRSADWPRSCTAQGSRLSAKRRPPRRTPIRTDRSPSAGRSSRPRTPSPDARRRPPRHRASRRRWRARARRTAVLVTRSLPPPCRGGARRGRDQLERSFARPGRRSGGGEGAHRAARARDRRTRTVRRHGLAPFGAVVRRGRDGDPGRRLGTRFAPRGDRGR